MITFPNMDKKLWSHWSKEETLFDEEVVGQKGGTNIPTAGNPHFMAMRRGRGDKGNGPAHRIKTSLAAAREAVDKWWDHTRRIKTSLTYNHAHRIKPLLAATRKATVLQLIKENIFWRKVNEERGFALHFSLLTTQCVSVAKPCFAACNNISRVRDEAQTPRQKVLRKPQEKLWRYLYCDQSTLQDTSNWSNYFSLAHLHLALPLKKVRIHFVTKGWNSRPGSL